MTSVDLNVNVVISGLLSGSTDSPNVNAPIGVRRLQNYTQSGTILVNQIIDHASATVTIAAGATTTLNLVTGQTNPLNESISGAAAFAKVREIFVEHDAASLASGVKVFDAASDAFQGPLGAGESVTVVPGGRVLLSLPTAAGWTVDATHKNLSLENLDGSNAATVRYLVAGSV